MSQKICPLCHASFNAETLSVHICAKRVMDTNDISYYQIRLYILHFCTSCNNAFLGCYRPEYTTKKETYKLLSAAPQKVENPFKNSNVHCISSRFVHIYMQSSEAEAYGLTDACGLGFRKSLEFLVKDFAIYRHAEHRETIENSTLMSCIKEYISNNRIKTLAERSAWIGNDEAHYIKKHTERDVEDLKTFIKAIETFISAELAYDEAEKIQPIR